MELGNLQRQPELDLSIYQNTQHTDTKKQKPENNDPTPLRHYICPVHNYERYYIVFICQDLVLKSISSEVAMLIRKLTVTQRCQYAQPMAKARPLSTKRSAYSTKDPETGIKVASSPSDCLKSTPGQLLNILRDSSNRLHKLSLINPNPQL